MLTDRGTTILAASRSNAQAGVPPQTSLSGLAQSLFNTNEYLYVD
jgi:hypothetical protein